MATERDGIIIDLNLTVDPIDFHSLASDMYVYLQNQFRQNNPNRRLHRQKYYNAFGVIMANLVCTKIANEPLKVPSADKFYKDGNQNPKGIGSSIVHYILDWLLNLRLLEKRSGYFDKVIREGECAAYFPTDRFDLDELESEFSKLVRSFRRVNKTESVGITIKRIRDNSKCPLIVLRNADKEPIRLPKTEEIKAKKNLLSHLNRFLSEHQFQLDKIVLPSPRIRRLYDIDLEHHGRFYGIGHSYQNLPKATRKDLKIDGSSVAECDFSATFPSIAYQLTGSPVPIGELYTLDTLACIANKETEKIIAKNILNSMFNTTSRRTALLVAREIICKLKYKERLEFNLPRLTDEFLDTVIEEIIKRHEPIQHFFFSTSGMKFMFIESEICEEIIRNFIVYKKPILPVHDSFIVRIEDIELLKTLMNHSWQLVLSRNTDFKVIYPSNIKRVF